MIELIGNLQTYELGLTRLGKSSKGNNVALKAKSNEKDESSEDEDSKFQRLTTSFEEIKMEEDESFNEFYAKLKNIENSTFNLGETFSEPKIIRKVLRSLPQRFHAKITTIEESKDIDKIPLTELVGNL